MEVCSSQPSTRNTGDVEQHLVNASFDVMFEESGEAGMFSSDDHQFQQQADKTRARLDESPKTLCGTHGGKGTYTVLDCTTAARSQGSLPEHEGKGMCTLPGCTTNAKARGLCCKHGGGTRTVCGHLG